MTPNGLLERLPMRALAGAALAMIAIGVAFQLGNQPEQRADVELQIGAWVVGIGEIVLGLLVVAAVVRHERRR